MAAAYKKKETGSPEKISSSSVPTSQFRSNTVGTPTLSLNEDPLADPANNGFGGNYEGIIYFKTNKF